jgi:hypothetical protein
MKKPYAKFVQNLFILLHNGKYQNIFVQYVEQNGILNNKIDAVAFFYRKMNGLVEVLYYCQNVYLS